MRGFVSLGLALLSIACGDATEHDGASGPRALAVQADGGVDAGPDPTPCNWYVYWLTMIDREEPCNWGMQSKNPTVALFRTNGGECLAPVTVCGIALCADVTFVREKQVIEVWGPAGLDAGAVWAATESFECEEGI